MRVTLAMLFYFGLVFGVGFLLGPIRVLWLEPHWTDHCEGLRSALYVAGHPSRGALGTTRLEHPARSKNARLGVGSLVKWRISRSASGCGASPQENNVQLLTGQGNIYAASLTLFAIMPWAANCWPELLKLHDHDRWGQL